MTNPHAPSVRLSFKLVALVCATVLILQNFITTVAWACRENAMIVFDASGSMARRHNGRTKIKIARRAVTDVLPSVTKYRETGLVTYGGIDRPGCKDAVVRVEPDADNGDRIAATLQAIPPVGPTALTDGVGLAADVLQQRGAPGVVVLITDGLETCEGNPCVLAQQLKKRGDQIRVHVISFLIEDKRLDTLKCLTQTTSGAFVEANSLGALRDALRRLLTCMHLSAPRRGIG